MSGINHRHLQICADVFYIAAVNGRCPKPLAILFRKSPVLRPRDLAGAGLKPRQLYNLTEQGVLVRTSRGLYSLAEDSATEKRSFVEVTKLVPKAILCLLSALRFHDLTEQNPNEVWLALDRKAWRPRIENLPVRIVRFSGRALQYGIETHIVEGVPIRVTSVARTIADCFKYRNKLGLDVALEALREGWRKKRFSMDELWKCAEVCRVARVLKPYLEAIA